MDEFSKMVCGSLAPSVGHDFIDFMTSGRWGAECFQTLQFSAMLTPLLQRESNKSLSTDLAASFAAGATC